MAYKKYKREYNDRYNLEHYKIITLRVGIDEKEFIREHALEMSQSVNAFILRAIYETIDRDKKAAEEFSKAIRM